MSVLPVHGGESEESADENAGGRALPSVAQPWPMEQERRASWEISAYRYGMHAVMQRASMVG